MMKKLLIMASLFWPQKKGGGPPVSIMNLVLSIKDDFDIYIISKNHELDDDKPLEGIQEGWNQFPFGKAYYVPKGMHSLKNILSLIKYVNPDVIYQNSFFSADDLLPVLLYKKKNKHVKVIVAPRGELYPERISQGKLKKNLYGNILSHTGMLKDVYFQGTNKDECSQIKQNLHIPDNYLLDIQNIAAIHSKIKKNIEKQTGELKLVYIARIHPTKNLLNAIRWLGQVKGKVLYDIYGSIEDENYWRRCQDVIDKLPDNITVNYKGMIEHEKVADIISNYHVYYMPTIGENFGHSIVEALLVGRPVIISDQTPWTDVNSAGSYAIDLAQPEKFIECINEMVDMSADDYIETCKRSEEYIIQKLNNRNIIMQYKKAFGG